MCGRYTARFTDAAHLPAKLTGVIPAFAPRYNIAPQQKAPVIRQADGNLVFEELRWGFRSAWMKDKNKAQINARSETLIEKPMFKHSALNCRCLVLTNGWYEWQQTTTGKQPFAFRLKDDILFAFAGIWTSWYGEETAQEDNYAIITTAASPLIAPVHNRMPVILDQDGCEIWLDTNGNNVKRMTALLQPYQGSDLEFYPVSTRVNNPKNTDEGCLKPLGNDMPDRSDPDLSQ